MVIYNIYQLVACVYVIKTQLEDKELPPSDYFSKCTKAVSFLKHPHLYNFTSVVYWLKASEMLETIVFVLRKKHNQISFLHVFHHCATITMSYLGGYSGHGGYSQSFRNWWLFELFFPVRAAYLAICINSFVHIVMYSYYLAAAVLSDEIVAKLTPIKKSITTLQMVQFTIILIHVLINRFFHGCRYNDLYVSIFCTFVAIIYYNFYVFYKKTYTNKESKVVKNGVNKSVTKGHWFYVFAI